MKARKRLAALAAAAIVTLVSGITVAISSHIATAVQKAPKPAAVAVYGNKDIQKIKLMASAHLLAAETSQVQTTYTVQSGEYLSTISQKLSGSPANWPALWFVNKATVTNPDALKIDQVLYLPASWTVTPAMKAAALAAIPQSQPAPVATAAATSAPAPAPSVPSGNLQAYALQLLGGNSTQFSCLNSIIMRESSWRVTAYNPSGAYGIPQALPGSKMSAAGPDWATDGDTQLRWMILMYIPGTYGTPCNAWAHEQATGSY